MPPPISDDEASQSGSENEFTTSEMVNTSRDKKGKVKAEEPEESLMVESESGMEDEEEDEELDEEEYVVERITNHLVDKDGTLRFEVKWEGYDKKSERTWEPEENLVTAQNIVDEYLESLGGRDAIVSTFGGDKSAKKGKKRRRPNTSVDTPPNGTKRGRKPKLEHPLDTTPPASSSNNDFVPPTGNWEEEVRDIDACQGTDGKPIVFLTWKNGHKSQHPLPQIYKRCPQKMLQFYERHLVFKRGDS